MPNSVGKRRSSSRARLVIVCALAGFLLLIVLRSTESAPNSHTSAPAMTAAVHAEPVSETRPVYRHSVVRGGVYSHGEATAAANADAVVRAHYKPLSVYKLMPVVLDRAVDRYVSFRHDDRIYWTTRCVRVPKGELLLSDGES